MLVSHCATHHCSIHCILPPHVLEHMAECKNPKLRKIARDNIAAGAEQRAMRTMMARMPMMAAMASPAGKKHRLIYDMRNRPAFMLPGTLVRSEGERATKDVAVNEAYNYSGYTYDFYKKNFGRNSLDDNGMTLRSSVHVGRDYNNAFWNGEQMAYGDGDGVVFTRFTKSMDVVGHELTHGVVSHTSNLEYRAQPGALNEHFADVFGVLLVQWRNKQTAKSADWLIGKDILVPAPTRKALRSMKAPGTAYQNDPELGNDPQPAHMDDYFSGPADNYGVHINSGIPNHAFYLAATAVGGRAWEKVGKVWYDTLLDLKVNSQFVDAAEKSIENAGKQSAAIARAVKKAWKDVGVNV